MPCPSRNDELNAELFREPLSFRERNERVAMRMDHRP